jgi:ABC-type transport system substrate-binding protein
LTLNCVAATRPHYGGVLRVEIHESIETADPPQSGSLAVQGFTIFQWEGGRRAVYSADPAAAGGRPFLDGIEIQMGRSLHDQSLALDHGKADLVEFDPSEPQRAGSSHKLWPSAPVRLLLLVFGPRIEDARVREALALSVDRSSIHRVMLQRQGEISGALLPQWLSGDAFLFPVSTDVAKARALLNGVPPAVRTFSLGAADPANRRIADRIALNARDAGLTVSAAPPGSGDVRLVEVRITSSDPALALTGVASALGLPQPPRTDSLEALFAAERALLEGFRVVPLFHLPDTYEVGPRVKGAPGITPLGEWRFENLWVEGGRP